MRYGENHIKMRHFTGKVRLFRYDYRCQKIQGKELSYNNSCLCRRSTERVKSFKEKPTCVIVKHANPAVLPKRMIFWSRRPMPPSELCIGGIIAFNRELDEQTAAEIIKRQFVEVIIAPTINPAAQAVLG